MLCVQCMLPERHDCLEGVVQTYVTGDRLAHGAMEIDPNNVNIRKLIAARKYRCAITQQMIPRQHENRHVNSELAAFTSRSTQLPAPYFAD